MKRCLQAILAIALFHPIFVSSQTPYPKGELNKLSLLFVGDVMGHSPQIESAYDSITKTYSYDSVFSNVSRIFNSYDVTIANLEVTLGGKPYTGYPQFSSPDALAEALKRAGVDILVTANNHSVDRGKRGIVRTINTLDSLNLPHTGTFLDSIQRDSVSPLLINKNGLRVALLNYTYGTNGLAVPYPTIVNLIDTALIKSDVARCRQKEVDEIIVFFHWGIEYEREPNADQKKLAKFCHNLGIRVVIGSHPHVIQKMEAIVDQDSTINEVTVYSLGNFVSNQRAQYRNGGALATMTLEKDSTKINITNPGFHLIWVNTPTISGKKVFRILPITDFENRTGSLNADDKKLFEEFVKDSRNLLQSQNFNFPEKKIED